MVVVDVAVAVIVLSRQDQLDQDAESISEITPTVKQAVSGLYAARPLQNPRSAARTYGLQHLAERIAAIAGACPHEDMFAGSVCSLSRCKRRRAR